MPGLSESGLEMLAKCVQRNVDDAAFTTNAIIDSMQARIDRLEVEQNLARLREHRAAERMRWLLGYDPEEE